MTQDISLRAIDEEYDDSGPRVERAHASDTDWTELHGKMKARDAAMLKDYDNEVDTLLVFAGLFSAILTAFIVDVYQELKVDSDDLAANTLSQILSHLRGDRTDHSAMVVRASPSLFIIAVLSLWFVGLILSLISALFCIFFKQWLHAYSKWTDQHNLRDGLTLRGFYQANLGTWRIPDIFAALGVLLQGALVLFVSGLAIYLWTLSYIIAGIVTFVVAVMLTLSGMTIALPVVFEDCPYKFPLVYILLQFQAQGAQREWAERDLPIARNRFIPNAPISPLTEAIKGTALLLDVLPTKLYEALSESSAHDTAVQFVQTRIRGLSEKSTRLLVALLTADELLAEHRNQVSAPCSSSSASVTPAGNVDRSCFIQLWALTFGAIEHPIGTLVHALQHLMDRMRVEHGVLKDDAERHSMLTIQLMNLCGPLCRSGQLAIDSLSSAALALDSSPAISKHLQRNVVLRLSLEALSCAMKHIPQSAMAPKPTGGISPITPYVPLMNTLRARIEEAEQLAVHSQLGPGWNDLIAQCRRRLQKVSRRHNLFFCDSRTGYAAPGGISDMPYSISWTEQGGDVCIGSDDVVAWRLNLSEPKTCQGISPPAPFESGFFYPRFSGDGTMMVWGSPTGSILLWDLSAKRQETHKLGQGLDRLVPLAVSPDGNLAVLFSEPSSIVFCRTRDQPSFHVGKVDGHSARLRQAVFSPHPHELVATSSRDGTVKIWNATTYTCCTTLKDLGKRVTAISWAPGGQLLAVSVGDNIRIISWNSHQSYFTLRGHTGFVTGLSFSRSAYLASSSEDLTVRVWSIATRTCVATLTGPKEDVNSVAFSPDGRHLACAASDSAWIWEVNPGFSGARSSNMSAVSRLRKAARRLGKGCAKKKILAPSRFSLGASCWTPLPPLS